MLNNKEKEVVKNYYLEDYINTIRYILTFDEDVNNKYSVYIENKISDNDMSSLLIRIMSNKIGNVNCDLLLNKEIKGFVPSDVANEIVNEIKNHFAHNHYIVYSSVNTISKIQILQNERFALSPCGVFICVFKYHSRRLSAFCCVILSPCFTLEPS